MKILLLYELEHGALGELVHAAVADKPFLAGILSEEEIEDNTHKGDEEEDQYPCHRLGGLTIVHQDGDDSRNGYHDIKQQIYPVKINHIAFLLFYL